MSKGDYITAILRSSKTVFTFRDIALLWGEQSSNSSRVRLNYYVKNGDLYRIRRGLYSKDKHFSKIELATRIFTPSYISFETVLAQEGIIFQFYSQIFIASYVTRDITIEGQTYTFRQMKNQILTNSAGIKHTNEVSIATTERAFLDTLYVNTAYYFDNLRELDWDKVFEMLPLYENKRMHKKVETLHMQMARS